MTNEERDSVIMERLNEGMSLSDVQTLLAREYGIRMTYFELRMLAADLQVNWQKHDKPKAPSTPADVEDNLSVPEEEASAASYEEVEAADDMDAAIESEDVGGEESGGEAADDAEGAAEGETKVELDETPIPGAAMSGTVVFQSGASGKWALTRDGRFGFEPDEGSEEPTEEDFGLFQQELRKKMMGEDEPEDPNAGPTVVDVDAVVRPGVRISGTVSFSSGARGIWMIDMQGQLGFEPEEGSSKPTRRDVVKFQQELRNVLAQKGMM